MQRQGRRGMQRKGVDSRTAECAARRGVEGEVDFRGCGQAKEVRMDYQLEDWDWRRAARDSRVGGGIAGCLRRRRKGTR